jgi:hypothetical protein
MIETKPSEQEKEAWKNKIARVFLRNRIATMLSEEETSVREAIDQAKEYKKELKNSHVFDRLLESEFVVSEQLSRVMELLQTSIREKFPHVTGLSLVLLGSGVHGGEHLRNISQNKNTDDLDWAFVYTGQRLSHEIITDIKKTVDELLPSVLQQTNFEGELLGCDYYNGAEFNYLMRDDQGWWFNEITRLANSPLSLEYSEVLIAFYPSFPPEVNQQSREVILKALEKLYRTDEDTWEKFIRKFMGQWKQIHKVKAKHFHDDQLQANDKTTHMAIEVAGQSDQIMSASMESLLRGTKES